MSKNYSAETREIYHKQHTRIAHDPVSMERFVSMFGNEYFGVDENFFVGKKILDAGCGDTAKVIIAMHKLGATDIHGFDLGSAFIPVAEEALKHHQIPREDVTLHEGNLLDIPYPDETFDFTICHGVLIHLNTAEEVKKAFSELVRVTKHGGHVYTVFGLVDGLLEGAVIPAVRQYYTDNADFKHFIDSIEPKDIHAIIDFIDVERNRMENPGVGTPLEKIKDLFDVDFCVFLQNIIQAPIRLHIDESFIRNLYDKNGLINITRLHRYIKRKNIRKYCAPLHYNYENHISKMLYGSGNLEFLGKKK